jgi:hypothetical protein
MTGEQLVKASTEPSTMSLLGLVRHLTEVERYWIQICLAGLPVKPQLWTDEHPDGDFDLVDASQAARHNGHADLIRERVDGVTGE